MNDTRNLPEGLERTKCGCHNCVAGCKTMPGALIPGDLERIQAHVGDTSQKFVDTHFLASEGALLMTLVGPTRVPSLVPAQQPDGRCVFLDDADRCSIHPVAPYCCSYVDTHQGEHEGKERVYIAVERQLEAHVNETSYVDQVLRLAGLGRIAPPLGERRQKMAELMEE